jgi:hypothetical protein
MQAIEFFPLLYYIVIFFSDAPSPCVLSGGLNKTNKFNGMILVTTFYHSVYTA